LKTKAIFYKADKNAFPELSTRPVIIRKLPAGRVDLTRRAIRWEDIA